MLYHKQKRTVKSGADAFGAGAPAVAWPATSSAPALLPPSHSSDAAAAADTAPGAES